MNAIAIAIHLIAATIWVGGMFFAYVVLRSALMADGIEPGTRLGIWSGVFKRFFPWVWLSILVLVLSGYWLVLVAFGGFSHAPAHVHLMHTLAIVMIALFAWIYFRLLPPFRTAVAAQSWKESAAALNRIRQFILINLVLGLTVVVVASAGRYL